MAYGHLEYGGNELTVASTIDDPPKVRLAGISGGGGFTISRIRPDGVQEEEVLLLGGQDERYRDQPWNYTGELNVFIRHWQSGVPDDAQFKKVIRFRHDRISIAPGVQVVVESW